MKRLGLIFIFIVLFSNVFAAPIGSGPPDPGTETNLTTSDSNLLNSVVNESSDDDLDVTTDLCGNGICEGIELLQNSCQIDCVNQTTSDTLPTTNTNYNPLLDYEDSVFDDDSLIDDNMTNLSSGINSVQPESGSAMRTTSSLADSSSVNPTIPASAVVYTEEFDYDMLISEIQRNRYIPPEVPKDNTSTILLVLVVMLMVISSIQIGLNVMLLKKSMLPKTTEEQEASVYNPINKKLKSYIKENLKSFDYDTIKKSLMHEGFTSEEIDEIYIEVQGEV